MKKLSAFALLAIASGAITGCRLAGGILRLGVWSGVVGVVLVIAVIGGLISFFRS